MNFFKWTALGIGTFVVVSHIGVLGYIINSSQMNETPTINFPKGEYSSYIIQSDKEGYTIEYRANDPAVLSSERSLGVDKGKKGFFGSSKENRTEYRREEYIMDNKRNPGGASIDGTGKSAKEIECIVEDAGARSQGAIAGTSIAAGIGVPAVIGIPYVGWLAAGWISLLGGRIGSEAGSAVGSVFGDC